LPPLDPAPPTPPAPPLVPAPPVDPPELPLGGRPVVPEDPVSKAQPIAATATRKSHLRIVIPRNVTDEQFTLTDRFGVVEGLVAVESHFVQEHASYRLFEDVFAPHSRPLTRVIKYGPRRLATALAPLQT
jgi:hypothetical protein